jgi:Uma2 family endonuclease
MPPTNADHGYLEVAIAAELRGFVRSRRLGWVLAGEVGIYTRRNPDRVRGADVVFVSRTKAPARLPAKYLTVAPDLVVEIVSPTDLKQDLQVKIEEYFAIGVPVIWVVEPTHRTVLVYHTPTHADCLAVGDELRGEGPLEGFILPVAEIFAP